MSAPALHLASRAERLAAWDLPVSAVRLVDAVRVEAFGRLGITTVGDLLRHYPHRYMDLTSTPALGQVRPGADVTVVGTVHDVKMKRPRRRLSVTEVAIVDGTGALVGVWFNQAYMAQRFKVGERVALAGKVSMDFGLKQIRTPFYEKLGAEDDASTLGRILPVHGATEGLSTNWIRRLVREAVQEFGDVPDPLLAKIRAERDLAPLSHAILRVHFPDSWDDVSRARRRLAYDELLTLQLGLAMRRHSVVDERPGTQHSVDGPLVRRLWDALPFDPTEDQQTAVAEILGDMASERPMNRMLVGEVGSGKTAVAVFALCAAVDTGSQAVMMAPTEVLAAQYARKVGPLLDEVGVEWALLTGSLSAAERREALSRIASGKAGVVFGTHALLEKGVAFRSLTLAIVDEQHRFGVAQRLGLRAKGPAADMLVMTATPIPRSLALSLYGDLDASWLRERPGGRTIASHVETRLVTRRERREAYAAVRRAAQTGHQSYVVCPLVEESDATSATAASSEAKRLEEEVFPDLRVALLTGRMPSSEKTAVMDAFRAGEVDVLVATSVIEVGVDVPNATVMIVEDAERFGLAQLHQLRGRIGRGEVPGVFLLFADPITDEARERMRAIVEQSDGFALSEADLSLRGEGQLLGERQHGLPDLKIASIRDDSELVGQAREDARAMIAADPRLRDPEHAPLALELHRRFQAAWNWVSSG